jgi:hypothetical protein
MKKILFSIGMIVLVLMMNGCFPHWITLNTKLEMVKPVKSADLFYSDDLIEIKIVYTSTQIGFVLRNKSDKGFEVDWDRVNYVNPEGILQPVIHAGIKLIQKNEKQTPTYVPAGTTLMDSVTPKNNIEWATDHWYIRPLMPLSAKEEYAENTIRMYSGRTISLVIPIKIENTIKEYKFDFIVELSKYIARAK